MVHLIFVILIRKRNTCEKLLFINSLWKVRWRWINSIIGYSLTRYNMGLLNGSLTKRDWFVISKIEMKKNYVLEIRMVLFLHLYLMSLQLFYVEGVTDVSEMTFKRYVGKQNVAINDTFLDFTASSRIECCMACRQTDRCNSINFRCVYIKLW